MSKETDKQAEQAERDAELFDGLFPQRIRLNDQVDRAVEAIEESISKQVPDDVFDASFLHPKLRGG